MKNIPQKIIKPSLLDRLTDNTSDKNQDLSKDIHKNYDHKQLKKSVERDLQWLFETVSITADPAIDFADKPYISESVINYGMPDMVGMMTESLNTRLLEKKITLAIQRYEPRIIAESLVVKVRLRTSAELAEDLDNNKTTDFFGEDIFGRDIFEISLSGYIWSQPKHVEFSLTKQINLINKNLQHKISI